MMISTKGRYALRIMLDLCEHFDEEGYTSLSKIAERQQISVKYLEAIVALLNRAGLVESLRGKEGGYKLIKKPGDYTVGSIIRLTEGSVAPVSCLECEKNNCERACRCLTLPMWAKLDGIVNEYLDGITLENLLEHEV